MADCSEADVRGPGSNSKRCAYHVDVALRFIRSCMTSEGYRLTVVWVWFGARRFQIKSVLLGLILRMSRTARNKLSPGFTGASIEKLKYRVDRYEIMQ